MPTYQYSCTECGHQLEAVQSFKDEPLSVCPECEGRLRKVFNSVGIVFKGSGFYRTDSRNGVNGGDPKVKSESESKSDGKSESKTETKTETKPKSEPKSGPVKTASTAPSSSS
ncbi:MAG TPA: FmdB family zinc ribbon protein [Asanoa sp.]|nr:FmdB family zinc ribbon protein [Asanoa sp.]